MSTFPQIQFHLLLLVLLTFHGAFQMKVGPDQVDFFLQLFDTSPKDDGISTKEIDEFFDAKDQKEAIHADFMAADKNGDGQVNREEMLNYFAEQLEKDNPGVSETGADGFAASVLDQIMDFFDENQDGFISEAEVDDTLGPKNRQILKGLVQRADVNGDGKADRQELLDAMAKEGGGE